MKLAKLTRDLNGDEPLVPSTRGTARKEGSFAALVESRPTGQAQGSSLHGLPRAWDSHGVPASPSSHWVRGERAVAAYLRVEDAGRTPTGRLGLGMDAGHKPLHAGVPSVRGKSLAQPGSVKEHRGEGPGFWQKLRGWLSGASGPGRLDVQREGGAGAPEKNAGDRVEKRGAGGGFFKSIGRFFSRLNGRAPDGASTGGEHSGGMGFVRGESGEEPANKVLSRADCGKNLPGEATRPVKVQGGKLGGAVEAGHGGVGISPLGHEAGGGKRTLGAQERVLSASRDEGRALTARHPVGGLGRKQTEHGPADGHSENILDKGVAVDPAGMDYSVRDSRFPARELNLEEFHARHSRILSVIDQKARKYGLPPNLVAAVVRVESGFDPKAVSPAGAKGLMQLMPATARELKVKNVFDIRENLDGGCRYLKGLLDRYDGRVELALAAYNAGPGAVARHSGVPPYRQTVRYVSRVLEHC